MISISLSSSRRRELQANFNNENDTVVSGWTALVYACAGAGSGAGAAGGGATAAGAIECGRRLLAAGARVDGAPARGDDVCTLTPLQVIAMNKTLSNRSGHSCEGVKMAIDIGDYAR